MSKEVRRAFQSFIKHYCYYCQTIFAYNGSVVPAPRTLLDLGLNNLGPKTLAVVCGGGTYKDTPTYQRYGILLFLYLRPWSPQATAYQRYASFVQQDDPLVSSRVGPCPCTSGAGARVLLSLLMSGVGTK